ncbi:hypothetical protein BDN67DRAFT_228818 [Paxillus ammoniavirescens]|nr:hypothetical protein BDN67DRAFT_228818 [Paxillus ammoniavirescens]
MVPTILPEICLWMAQFIPSSIRRNLHSVNPVFLDLALNDRYSDIQFFGCWTAVTAKYLEHLNHPHRAHRVQRLALSSNWLEASMCSGVLEEDVTLRTAPGDIKMCNVLMESTVVNFPSSRTRPEPLFLNTCAAYTSNLRTPTLTTHPPNFNALFPANASVLMSLEQVTPNFAPGDDFRADSSRKSLPRLSL